MNAVCISIFFSNKIIFGCIFHDKYAFNVLFKKHNTFVGVMIVIMQLMKDSDF
jgi:hypothetical protein